MDAAVTAPCFGFATVDDYYEEASSDKRLKDLRVPVLLINALDDPIAPGAMLPFQQVRATDQVIMAVTTFGGHLGWCDPGRVRGGSAWIENSVVDFLELSLDLWS